MTGQKLSSAGIKKPEPRVSEWQSFGNTGSSQKKSNQTFTYPVTTSAEMSGWDTGTLQAIVSNWYTVSEE